MRDRSTSKSDEAESEVTFEPAPEMVKAVSGEDEPKDASQDTPKAEDEPEQPKDRDTDLGDMLFQMTNVLKDVAAKYGEDVARQVGEKAIINMRKAGGPA